MSKNNPARIILHCSDTPDSAGDIYGFKEINEWHAKKGWLDHASGVSCGYHRIIRPSGNVELGRPVTSIGAHTYGHNRDSLSICLIGRERVTFAQLEACLQLCTKWCLKYQIPFSEVRGHYEFNSSKTCPGQDVRIFRKWLKKRLEINAVSEIRKILRELPL